MATGQQGFDPDDFIRRDRERDQQRREQQRIDEMRRDQERNRTRDEMQRRAEQDSLQRMADVVNDADIIVDKEMMDAINDPEIVMTPRGELARVTRRTGSRSGRDTIRRSGQFANLALGIDVPKKRRRKKNGNDKKLSKAFKEANAKLRTKSGKLRKGKTQADVARLAQRLRKKMK